MKKTVSLSVNLLPEDPFFETIVGRSMRWAVSVGRYIVIFTELIVILSFATRFSLDRQITDLNDAIFQKASVIRSFGQLENDILSVQGRINEYQQLQQRENLAEVFPALSAVTPQDVSLTTLSIQPTQVTMRGSTLSQASLNLLLNNIQLSSDFFNIRVSRIESTTETEGEILFEIMADTKQNPTATVPAAGLAAPVGAQSLPVSGSGAPGLGE